MLKVYLILEIDEEILASNPYPESKVKITDCAHEFPFGAIIPNVYLKFSLL